MSTKPTYEALEKQIAELKQRADECQAEAQKYRTLFNSFPHGISVSDENGNIIETNAMAEKLLSVNKEQHEKMMIDGHEWRILRTDGSVMPHEEWPSIIALKENRMVTNCEMGVVKPGDDVVWINVTATPLSMKGYGVVITYSDITRLKTFEESLGESEERFEKVYTHMSVGVAQISMDFLIEHANEAYCQMLGYNEEELIGKHLKEITHPEVVMENLEKQSRLASGEIDHYRMDKKFIHKNGHVIHGILDANLVRDAADKPIYFLGSVLDITERKRMEAALMASEEKYRSMMEAMKNAAYISSPDLIIEYMNPRMISRVGQDVTGELCHKAIYGYEKQCPWCLLDNVLQGEQVDYELANPVDNRYYSVTNSPLYHSNGQISKLTIFHDITENKTVEAQLRQARKMESIGTMAGGIAHDFNNILYMITGNAELAMDDIPEWSPAYDSLNAIKAAGLRAADIVKKLLHFTRQTDQDFKPIDAISTIKEALKFMRATIPTTIDINPHFPTKEIMIHGDSTQINQMMMNLCINASQAMEESGGILDVTVTKIRLEEGRTNLPHTAKYETAKNKNGDHFHIKHMAQCCSALPAGEWAKISVRDTGPGIHSETIERIFDPYFTTKDVGKGSGMGLTIVHGIVKNHHGAIYVDSELEQGTTFTIFLPVVTEKPKRKVETYDKIPHGNGEKILFVDDEPIIVEMTTKILKRLRYDVEAETNSINALERFRSKPDAFDIVLTDMTMPNLDGAKLAKKLKEIRPNIPVILCTGHNALINEDEVKSMGSIAMP